jgi:hypothetical protein
MTKRAPTEVWKALAGEDGEGEADADADIEAVLAMTPEERRRELEKAGVDLERFHAEADARAISPAKPTPLGPRRARPAVFAVVAALAIAAGAAVIVHVRSQGDVVGSPPGDPRAEKLRGQASDACDAREWKTCLAKLDEAKAIDPAGDGAREVEALRKSAEEHLKTP